MKSGKIEDIKVYDMYVHEISLVCMVYCMGGAS